MDAMSSGRDAIHDVSCQPLSVISTDGGSVLHMLRADSPLFSGFGECYFSEIEPGVVRAWKRHQRQTQHFAVPCGRALVVLHDSREASPSRGVTAEYRLGRPDAYQLLVIPPGLWYGFAAVGAERALIANLTDMPHDPAETDRMPLEAIAHRWPL